MSKLSFNGDFECRSKLHQLRSQSQSGRYSNYFFQRKFPSTLEAVQMEFKLEKLERSSEFLFIFWWYDALS